MVTIALSTILARARTISSQLAGDANSSPLIDDLGGLRALLNHAILEVYRRKATNPNFIKDINLRQNIVITAGSGTLPDNIIREYLRSADWQDANGSLISYFDYPMDFGSGQNYNQLGYVTVNNSTISYTEPSPGTSTSYTGNLTVSAPSTPTIGANIDFESQQTSDDVILLLARAIRGEVKFLVADVIET